MAEATYLEAIREALYEELARDERVLLLGEDIGAYGGAFKVTDGLHAKFGADRVIDTPISEAGIIGAAVGAAMMGLRPVAEMQFIDFLSNGFNMLSNFAAKNRYRWGVGVPLVVRGPAGGGVGAGPFHSQNPESYYVHTPGLKVVQPATPRDAKGLLKSAIRDDDPVLFLEHKALYRRVREELPDEDYTVPIGRAEVRRRGGDVSIVTYGAMVWLALEAAEVLATSGVEAEVVDLRSLLPYDRDAVLESVARTSRVVLLHEATRTGGFAGELAALIAEEAFEELDAPVTRITAEDTPVPYNPILEKAFLPTRDKLVEAVKRLVRF